jgi:predicted GIY-YIG superfamily endonuclease
MTWYCYILRSINPFYSGITYNGSTNDLVRRLRQHNGEIKGGAKATHNKGPWEYYAILTGFETHQETLSCEWRIKHPTNNKIRPRKYCGINGRIESLKIVLNLDNWTNKCVLNNVGLCTGKEYTLYLANDVINIINIIDNTDNNTNNTNNTNNNNNTNNVNNLIKSNVIVKSLDLLEYNN